MPTIWMSGRCSDDERKPSTWPWTIPRITTRSGAVADELTCALELSERANRSRRKSRFMSILKCLSRIPNFARIRGIALIGPGVVNHPLHVHVGAPSKEEFGLRIVEPGGAERGRDLH